MHSAFTKILSHPIVLQDCIQYVAPEVADAIDFSTLEALGPESVGDDLARRFPGMVWIVRTRHSDGQVVILLYVTTKNDPMMSVRVAFDSYQVVRELYRRMRPPPDLTLRDVVPVVVHRGSDRWTAPRSLEELFARARQGDLPDTGAKA